MRATLVVAILVLASLGTAAANHPQSAGTRTTSFDHRTGNEWWVEVIVAGNPRSVQARDDGGDWKTLTLKSWGAWAASFHIEPGHRVQFRASWSNGDGAESCWFTHPAGVEECDGGGGGGGGTEPGAFTFDHAGGNEWWVEVKVDPMPGKVEAMDVGGAWTPLSFRSWGEWANSFHIEPGHQVKFRALAPDGVWHESCWFSHPAGVETPCGTPPPPSWPIEGSFVEYHAYEGESFPNYWQETETNATYTFSGGQWNLVCDGNTHAEIERYNETSGEWEWVVTDTPFHDESQGDAPPRGPETPSLGDFVPLSGVACLWGGIEGTTFGPIRFPTRQNGSDVDVTAYFVDHEPIWPAAESGAWDARTRLVLDWGFSGSHGYWGGSLTDTDAPLAKQVTPRTSWPFEGSFVHYRANQTGGDLRSDIRFTFQDGGWTLDCTLYETGGGTVVAQVERSDAPWHGPSNVAVGDAIEVPLVHHCGSEQWNELLVERTQSVMTTRNGAAYKARVWYADENDTWTDVDFDVWWDTRTRLYLEWDFNEWQGRLVNTDAPLAPG